MVFGQKLIEAISAKSDTYHRKEHLKGSRMTQISNSVAPSCEELLVRNEFDQNALLSAKKEIDMLIPLFLPLPPGDDSKGG